jgi:hypothetical protein
MHVYAKRGKQPQHIQGLLPFVAEYSSGDTKRNFNQLRINSINCASIQSCEIKLNQRCLALTHSAKTQTPNFFGETGDFNKKRKFLASEEEPKTGAQRVGACR